jgi:hypothetical protein
MVILADQAIEIVAYLTIPRANDGRRVRPEFRGMLRSPLEVRARVDSPFAQLPNLTHCSMSGP